MLKQAFDDDALRSNHPWRIPKDGVEHAPSRQAVVDVAHERVETIADVVAGRVGDGVFNRCRRNVRCRYRRRARKCGQDGDGAAAAAHF